MTKHYFPDTNVLICYFTGYNKKENKLAKNLINATRNKTVKGIITSGVKLEFDTILDNSSIAHAQNIANKLLTECNNSKPRLIEKLNKYYTVFPSETIVLEQFSFNINKNRAFNESEARLKLIEIGNDFKIKKNEILKLMKHVNENKFAALFQQFENEIGNIRLLINRNFPINKDKDEKDNSHIINSAIACKKHNISGTFITNDNLRVVPKREFKKRCKEVRRKIMTHLKVTFFIEQLEEYCKFYNIT